ncbi:MAG: hypothetical protein RIE31_02885 [Alphaproteobacteria bacterium]
MTTTPYGHTPTQQVESLIATASRLVALLEDECGRLRQIGPRDIVALQEDKSALIQSFEKQYRALEGNPTLLQVVAPALRAEMESAITHFAHVAAANERALRAARECNDRLLRAIADSVVRQQPGADTYDAAGIASRPAPKGASRPAMAINGRY